MPIGRPRVAVDDDAIAAMYQQGVPFKVIAAKLGVGTGVVWRRLQERSLGRRDGGAAVRSLTKKAAREAEAERRCERNYGVSRALLAELTGRSLLRAFTTQRTAAARRGIEWSLTLGEWYRIWSDSGNLDRRGRGRDRYVMGRDGDVGPYAPWNVRIITNSQNAREARANHPESNGVGALSRTGTGRGWTLQRGRFQVYVSKKYIGTFISQGEAEVAYQDACAVHLGRASGAVS